MTDAPTSFADLALRPSCSTRSRRSATRSRRRSSARRSRRCSRAATCSARPRPARARPRRSRCRSSSGSTATRGRRRRAALVLVPTRELAMQVSEAIHSYGRGLGVERAADLRRAADRPPAAGAASAASTSSWRRPAARSTTSAAAPCASTPSQIVVLDEADEMLDMGFAEDIEAILGGDPDEPPDRAVLGHDAAAHRPASPAATCATRSGSRSAAQAAAGRRGAAGAPDAPTSSARAHKPAALGRVLDVEAPTAAIVFCRTRDEVDQLTETLNGRGYRAEALHGGHDPGAARPRHGPAARRRRPTCWSPPTSPRAGSTSTSSPTSSTTTCRRRPRPTCTGSAGSAAPGARASPSRWPSRASTACSRPSSASPSSGSRSRRCRPSPTCAPAAWSSPRAALEEHPARGRPRALPRRRRVAGRRVRRHGDRPRRGQAGPRGRRAGRPTTSRRSPTWRRASSDAGPRRAAARRARAAPRRARDDAVCSSARAASAGIRPQDLVGRDHRRVPRQRPRHRRHRDRRPLLARGGPGGRGRRGHHRPARHERSRATGPPSGATAAGADRAAPLRPGRRVRARALRRQPGGGRPRRRRALRGRDAAPRALDEPVRDDVRAAAGVAGRRLPRADPHPGPGAALRRASDARDVPRVARGRRRPAPRGRDRAGVRRRPRARSVARRAVSPSPPRRSYAPARWTTSSPGACRRCSASTAPR